MNAIGSRGQKGRGKSHCFGHPIDEWNAANLTAWKPTTPSAERMADDVREPPPCGSKAATDSRTGKRKSSGARDRRTSLSGEEMRREPQPRSWIGGEAVHCRLAGLDRFTGFGELIRHRSSGMAARSDGPTRRAGGRITGKASGDHGSARMQDRSGDGTQALFLIFGAPGRGMSARRSRLSRKELRAQQAEGAISSSNDGEASGRRLDACLETGDPAHFTGEAGSSPAR